MHQFEFDDPYLFDFDDPVDERICFDLVFYWILAEKIFQMILKYLYNIE